MSDRLALCYHALSERWPAPLAVAPERFERQLGWLADRGYRGATFSELVLRKRPGRWVAVTFDDGYRSVLRAGFPILERLGWPATVFVPAGLVGNGRPLSWPGVDRWLGGEHEPELAALSWEQLRSLKTAGWEVGSHTCTHPHLTRLADAELERELGAARGECERRLERSCISIAYPFGEVDPRVVSASARAGYVTGAGLYEQGAHGSNPLEWPRIGVYRADDQRRFRAKVLRAGRRVRRTPVWPVAKRLHDRLRRA